jgi:nucleotide-binding universal stress UspA family protein
MSQQQEGSGDRIVVGVDGSPSSKAALTWAVRQAHLTGASVEAIIAWHYPVMVGGYAWAPVSALEDTDFETISATVLSDAVGETVSKTSTVKVSTTVREGSAAQVLLEVADGADLLVVGSRGHGGFTGALLGSVSQHCAQHAPCPIVIFRTTRTS